MTIGIIEDDSLLNQALEIALQNAGYYTISAHTRKEALDLFRKKVDAFFIDIGLPDGNGIELYQELQMEKRIPAIFLTARPPGGILTGKSARQSRRRGKGDA